MLAVVNTSCSFRLKGSVSTFWICLATRVASVTFLISSSKIANSSPLRRATVSPGCRQLSSLLVIATSSWSPVLCPRLSLTTLKRSKSRKRTANKQSWRRLARSTVWLRRSISNARFGRPVNTSWKAWCNSCSSARLRLAISVSREALLWRSHLIRSR